jgi:hypothetical protein
MRGSILQPTYLPWSGYFEMIDATDTFVIYDHVQFVRKSWQKRNKIKSAAGIIQLSLPVKKAPRNAPIYEIEISYDRSNPLLEHWKTIQHEYQKAPFFENYCEEFDKIYQKKYELLRDLNVEIIQTICKILGIKTTFVYASDLNIDDENLGKSERVINLCKKAGLSYLYDAKGAESFLDVSMFEKENLEIKFQNYQPTHYPQLYNDHVEYLSIIDMLFNMGDETLNMIRAGRLD